ncbi:hypothetical protein A3F32_01450 [Candidatus Roizmanbacteria bacterium RIFCSPHIGHO2_12_FULL_42_10]|uniref:Uncharacterized protein n=3 Tax=Candidatus Roizmaniibacteriota TaxID=1752723 RepID=A0A1F7GLU4_9BACT|nr:MAG: hypothetical protein A2866_01380 [Candidatus Roizmanbacteria bacterium RIFCSPHIGHO2_01_FULL_39_8]OGK28198.1 MAG: hypothetical protein A3C28_03330 [Candidatus Roizmanbacteria bacterium RIFCSPHIGHO2_02_FULL_39_9]OGK38705.1 MAG: hypothetical protein A3F32_01450 [Candidatus Roizmanbacteria bacterium RIFCSPHIGHO2_12_FULL_42_10]
MIPKEACPQFQYPPGSIPVPCRGLEKYYLKGACPLRTCEAAEVLGDVEKLKVVVPENLDNNPLYRDELVFHRICPGANNGGRGGYEAFLRQRGRA